MSRQPSTTLDPPAVASGMADSRRLLGIFIRPQRTMRDIVLRPSLLVPWIVALVASLSIGFLSNRFVFTEDATVRVTREALARDLERRGLDADPSEDEVQARAASLRRLQRLWVPATTVELVVIVFGISGVFYGALRLLGGRTRFRAVLAVTSWSWMVWTLVFALVAWVGIALRSPASIDPTDPYTLSTVHLAGFLAGHGSGALHSVVVNLSLQNLWFLALLVVGYVEAAPEIPRARVAVVVLGLALLGFALRGVLMP